ncbi:ABC transporter ATP-binding protein, partial [bacterium]
MSNLAISVQNLSKEYRISQTKDQIVKRSGLTGCAHDALDALRGRGPQQTLVALDGVSFEVQSGSAVAIIGRNGAGKSTLLKLLSRITEPTSGRAVINGRVAALLEVGTGFHPELTGRENVFLSGAILGMRRFEIERRFDEIVAFSGVEKFLDTPIKYYSSGMRVRLGFAVAAHLEPEVLLIDEVLAVGDAEFQKKCLGKMNEVTREGRTVLFVSHNMGAVQTLCTHGIFLQNGSILIDGTVDEAVSYYLGTIESMADFDLSERMDRSGQGRVRLSGVEIVNASEPHVKPVITGGATRFEFRLNGWPAGLNFEYLDFTIYDLNGHAIVYFNSSERGPQDVVTAAADGKIVCDIDQLVLMPGRYRLNVGLKGNGEMQDHVEGAAFFNVEDGDQGDPRVLSRQQRLGNIVLNHRWT